MTERSPVYVAAARDRVLAAIVAHIEAYRYPPTVRELCQATGITSTSQVALHLDALEREGRIERDRGVSRGMRVVREIESDEECRAVRDDCGHRLMEDPEPDTPGREERGLWVIPRSSGRKRSGTS